MPVEQCSIRPAQIGDLNHLLSIEHDSFTTDLLNRRQMRYLLIKAKACCLLLEVQGVIVGYGICLTPKLPRPARLYSLAVRQEYRGKGLARALIEAFKKYLNCNNYKYWQLEVVINNHSAQKLYKDSGFEIKAQLPGYYENGCDALRMVCVLVATEEV
ncbi:GNAT family N-acetyltransferase [Microbulbifer sp. THAF38]|uniref:GNAT family N-acetyltransferase n=1 Tax=Microbulbifer sp. THAF38 TaxID=2587856 RepID=UPI001267ED8C|nr:N-acetyltransferase [Microbulbifer sp. THAF38]QFT56325.1 ribosomal-protein-alanine N-acetyltransferase [Microbulbifer sp. THAF38]